jgi:glutathione peroxidase
MIMTKYFLGTLLTTLFGCSVSNANAVEPPLSFYSLKARTLEGEEFDFAQLKGKRVLIVNTASECGFTPQYKELEELYQSYKDRGVTVIGFPCNQFGAQESASEADIETFVCSKFKVTFPMMAKVKVNGDDAQALAATRENKAAMMTACPAPMATVGMNESCDYRLTHLAHANQGMTFCLNGEPFRVPMDGAINVRNAAMAVCAALFWSSSVHAARFGCPRWCQVGLN